MAGVRRKAVLRLRVGCSTHCSKMLSGTALVMAVTQGSSPVSRCRHCSIMCSGPTCKVATVQRESYMCEKFPGWLVG